MSRGRGREVSTDSPVRIRSGRRAPYTQLGDWVMLASSGLVRPPAKVLYWALSAHLSARQDDDSALTVSPTLQMLAEMLGYSRRDKLMPYLDDLVALGAVEVVSELVTGEGSRRRNIYIIHQSPPEDYAGHQTLGDFYQEFRARRQAERAARKSARTGSADTTREGAAGTPNEVQESGTPNEVPDIEQDVRTRRRNKIGGRTAAPRTPAARTAGRDSSLVPMGGDQQGDQQTAHASARAFDTSDRRNCAQHADSDADCADCHAARIAFNRAHIAIDVAPSPVCDLHPTGTNATCGPCATLRRARETWDAKHAVRIAQHHELEERYDARVRAGQIAACRLCDIDGFRGAVVCDHIPTARDMSLHGLTPLTVPLPAETIPTTQTPAPGTNRAATGPLAGQTAAPEGAW